MGNAKSLNKAELKKAADDTRWHEDSEILAAVRDVKSKKKRSKKSNREDERHLAAEEVDDIYDLVLSLKKGGKEDRDLLDKFIERQTGLRPRSTTEAPPLNTVTIYASAC